MKVLGFKAGKNSHTQDWTRSVIRTASGYELSLNRKIEDGTVITDQVITIADSQIEAILAEQDSAYTLWACWSKLNGAPDWQNIYRLTAPTKIGRREYLRQISASPFAFLVVPPNGGEPALVIELLDGDTFTPGVVDREFAQAEFSDEIAAIMPTISLSSSVNADGTVTVTATSSYPIDGAEARWETTAGLVDVSRTKFVGASASALVRKPLEPVGFKVKVGFKYYTGLAEISL